MNPSLTFRPYRAGDLAACLALFDANCPAYFAPGERADYVEFLGRQRGDYDVWLDGDRIVGGCGVERVAADQLAIRWILIAPDAQGRGVGAAMMARVTGQARASGARALQIATSQKSSGFFERFGAVRLRTTEHGWGEDLHRIDMELVLSPGP